jgi:hypothetical protein
VHKRSLGEILVQAGLLSGDGLAEALRTKPEGMRLGEHLAALGRVSERDLYLALSRQQSLTLEEVEPHQVPKRVARALPAHVVRRWNVLPFKVASGKLFVIGPDLPVEAMQTDLRRFTRLEVRFHLTTPERYRRLVAELL